MTVRADADVVTAVARLRACGAVFGYLHGSRAAGTAGPGSDLDVAAWFGRPVDDWVVAGPLPGAVDVLVLDTAPLELAGRVALHGRLLFDDDPRRACAGRPRRARSTSTRRPRRDRARPTSRQRGVVVDPERLHRLLRRVTDDLAVLRGTRRSTRTRSCTTPSASGT